MDPGLRQIVMARLEADGSSGEGWGALVLGALEGREGLEAQLEGRRRPRTARTRRPRPRWGARSCARSRSRASAAIGRAQTLELGPGPGLTLVVGRNGSGKSSFAEALEVLLTGDSLRWKERAAVWRDGWRNLHHPAAALRATFLVEGERAALRRLTALGAGRRPSRPPRSRPSVARQAGRRTSTSLGWTAALRTYRPFLSYNELGSMLDEGPVEAVRRALLDPRPRGPGRGAGGPAGGAHAPARRRSRTRPRRAGRLLERLRERRRRAGAARGRRPRGQGLGPGRGRAVARGPGRPEASGRRPSVLRGDREPGAARARRAWRPPPPRCARRPRALAAATGTAAARSRDRRRCSSTRSRFHARTATATARSAAARARSTAPGTKQRDGVDAAARRRARGGRRARAGRGRARAAGRSWPSLKGDALTRAAEVGLDLGQLVEALGAWVKAASIADLERARRPRRDGERPAARRRSCGLRRRRARRARAPGGCLAARWPSRSRPGWPARARPSDGAADLQAAQDGRGLAEEGGGGHPRRALRPHRREGGRHLGAAPPAEQRRAGAHPAHGRRHAAPRGPRRARWTASRAPRSA